MGSVAFRSPCISHNVSDLCIQQIYIRELNVFRFVRKETQSQRKLILQFFTENSESDSRWDYRFSRRRIWRWLSSEILCRVVTIIAMMMETVSTSETSVNFYQTTRRNIPEESHLYIRCRENLKTHLVNLSGEATLRYVRRFEALRIPYRPDDGGIKHLWNVGKLLRDYTSQHARIQ
jgi:hypothetical protein